MNKDDRKELQKVTEAVRNINHTLHGNGAIGLIAQVRAIFWIVIVIAAMMLVVIGERFLKILT